MPLEILFLLWILLMVHLRRILVTETNILFNIARFSRTFALQFTSFYAKLTSFSSWYIDTKTKYWFLFINRCTYTAWKLCKNKFLEYRCFQLFSGIILNLLFHQKFWSFANLWSSRTGINNRTQNCNGFENLRISLWINVFKCLFSLYLSSCDMKFEE